ncbi:hypothetical protein DL96DRAFT_1680211 [Flagelloscypha sp. PMI_526]|nr:hypothetical protein DL96DRAFT_1680211 [Flagelloscypha sp. PMI_526]
MASLDSLLGTLLVSSWLDSGLFAIQIMQGLYYFQHYQDGWIISCLVVAIFCINLVGLSGEYATIYLDAIKHFGDKDYLQHPKTAPRAMYLISTQVTAFLVQSYLITRIHRLSERKALSCGLFIVALLALSGGLGLSIVNVKYPTLADRKTRQREVTAIWLAASAAVDIMIAGCLVHFFNQVRKASTFQNTRGVLLRLMSSAVETGSITAALATVVVVLFYTLQTTNWPVAFVFLLGRAYSVTLLYNLNVRARLQNQMQSSNATEEDTTASLGLTQPHRQPGWRGGIRPRPRRQGQTGMTSVESYVLDTTTGIEIQVSQSAVISKSDTRSENASEDKYDTPAPTPTPPLTGDRVDAAPDMHQSPQGGLVPSPFALSSYLSWNHCINILASCWCTLGYNGCIW